MCQIHSNSPKLIESIQIVDISTCNIKIVRFAKWWFHTLFFNHIDGHILLSGWHHHHPPSLAGPRTFGFRCMHFQEMYAAFCRGLEARTQDFKAYLLG